VKTEADRLATMLGDAAVQRLPKQAAPSAYSYLLEIKRLAK
jgi:hypothetical protein